MKKTLPLLVMFMCSCTAIVFQPTKQFYYAPERALQTQPDELDIQVAERVTLHAWRFHAKDGHPKAVVIQFHGNAENISSHYLSVAWMLNYGYDVISFDYRGYGLSEGIASFPEVVTDAAKVIEYVRELYKDSKINVILYGQSLGSIIAMNAAARSKVKIDQVILEGAIYSLNQVSADVLSRTWMTWIFQPLGHVLMTGKYNFKKIKKTFPKVPVYLIHSQRDPVISYKQSEKIYNALSEPKCLKLIPELTHINSGNVMNGKYRQDMLGFLEGKNCTSK